MTGLLNILTLAQSTTDDGLSFREIISDLPADPASLFTVALLVGSMLLVLWAGRSGGGKGGRPA